METKFEVKMTTSYMFDYQIYHSYSTANGLVGLFISIAAILILIIRYPYLDSTAKVVLVIAALLFTIINPIQLYTRAKRQVLMTPMFRDMISYEIDNEKIVVSQKGARAEVKWEEVSKIAETKKSVIVYMGKTRAFIFPKTDLKDGYDVLKKIASEKLTKKKNKLKNK